MRLNSRFFIAVCLVFSLLFSIWLRPAKAADSLTGSRINQLEFQVRSLQTQINQLQGQRPNSSTGNSNTQPDITPAYGTTPGELSLDQQFDNLATLVIEINQRVIKLEQQVSN